MAGYIPEPTGKYPVGIYKMDMIDENRKDIYHIFKENRKLAVWIFYPGARVGEKMHYGIKEDLKKMNIPWENNLIECCESIEPAKGSYPCIIYSHGYNSNIYFNTTFCADMASNGYVVVSISHPYEADTTYYQDGTMINFHKPFAKIAEGFGIWESIKYASLMLDCFSSYKTLAERQYSISKKRTETAMEHIAVWSEDNSFVLDKLIELNDKNDFFLYHLIDFSNGTGLAGHSFGGCAAVNSCYLDHRFSCVLNFDGAVFGKCSLKNIERPYMRIGQNISKYVALTPLAFNSAPSYDIAIKNVAHMGYTDWKYLPHNNRKMVGSLSKELFYDITTNLTHFFFNKYLYGMETVSFPSISKKYIRVCNLGGYL